MPGAGRTAGISQRNRPGSAPSNQADCVAAYLGYHPVRPIYMIWGSLPECEIPDCGVNCLYNQSGYFFWKIHFDINHRILTCKKKYGNIKTYYIYMRRSVYAVRACFSSMQSLIKGRRLHGAATEITVPLGLCIQN